MVKERRIKNTTKKEDVEWPILAEEIKDLTRKKKERYIVYIDSQTTSERKFGTHVSFKNHKGGRKKEKKRRIYTRARLLRSRISTRRRRLLAVRSPSPHTPNIPYVCYKVLVQWRLVCALYVERIRKREREKIKYLCPKQTEKRERKGGI